MKPMSSQSSETEDHFSGFLSGYQTSMKLSLSHLQIKIETRDKQFIYEATVEYNPQDPVFKQVKKIFKNLHLLFEYINDYSEDIDRIRVDLKDLKIEIVKNEGPRRLKASPVLQIPLKKIYVYEKKPQTKIQMDIDTAIKYNQVLRCKFEYEKKQRQKIMNQYNRIKDQIYHIIKSNNIDVKFLQEKKLQENPLIEKDLERILLESEYKSDNEAQESLFFEEESVHHQVPRLKGEKISRPQVEPLQEINPEQKSFIYDPFSYL